ncbi:MAG TPA: hypothetical protein DDZ80_17905 [Cyanobacteria bacterium UBA8803]|nr:hypothetical protein [Cyanobacteria bacterium UBA9273]HBL60260.1 hypothetical protein [Cyanobacteria bacterium UBA8803]
MWTAILLFGCGSVALAQTDPANAPNPLELDVKSDPLLPALSEEALDQLSERAAAELSRENREGAFALWFREIRLRRVLGGPIEEVKALGRVGEIAWRENYKPEVKLITARLQTIQREAQEKKTLDEPLLNALGQAYRQVRFPGPAIVVYEQILANDRQRGDIVAQEETLKTIAQLHLAWFDYPKAAATYEELLALAQARGDRFTEVTYLQELVNIYNQAQQPQNALRMKERLIQTYLNQSDYTKIPGLKIAIASDYEALGEPDLASQAYQEAYAQAWSLQQFASASEALQKLAALYRSYEQPEYALQVYETLINVDQQSYNFYGLMNTYDQMGQLYLDQKNFGKALEAFQQGLALAQSLQYQETHFARQIQRVNQQSSQ